MLALLLAAAAQAAGGPPGPDGLITVPGARNPEVEQANIQQTICVPGWSQIERKKLGSRAETLKKQAMAAANIPWSKSSLYELDHDASIEDGGSPTDPRNLSLQPYFGPRNAHDKDKVEDRIHALICSGKISLNQGFGELTSNWVAAYRKYVGPLP
jgi:hypothetical protein